MKPATRPTIGLLLVLGLVACGPSRNRPGEIVPPAGGDERTLTTLTAILHAELVRELSPRVLTAVHDERPDVRARVAVALGRVGSSEGRQPLLSLLEDPDAGVRATAAFALGLSEDPAVAQALARAASDEQPAVRVAVAEALGRVGGDEASATLAVLLNDDRPDVAAAAARQVWSLPDASFAVNRLIELTEAQDRETVFAAGFALARLGSAGLRPRRGPSAAPLSRALRFQVRSRMLRLSLHPDSEIRQQAARGLAVPDNATERETLSALLGDPDPRVRIEAVRSLAYSGAPLEPDLARALRDRDPLVVATAIAAVGTTESPDAVRALVPGMKRTALGWLRAEVAGALSRAMPGRAFRLAGGWSRDPSPLVRAAALRVMRGKLGEQDLPTLRRFLEDPDPEVRVACVAALGALPGPARMLLGEAATDEDPAIRAAVARALRFRLTDTSTSPEARNEARQMLAELHGRAMQDQAPVAALALLEALEVEGDDETRRLLRSALEHPHARVATAAAAQLRDRYGEARTVKPAVGERLPQTDLREIAAWSEGSWAARVTVRRPGFAAARFTLVLDTRQAPLTSWNFARLAREGFFDGLSVHRVVPGFFVHSGDPRGDGRGDPGYALPTEPNSMAFAAGTVAMAGDGRLSHGSQWFVALSPQPQLARSFTAFGRVVQNLPGVVMLLQPGDLVESVEIYEGDGSEPLPAPTGS